MRDICGWGPRECPGGTSGVPTLFVVHPFSRLSAPWHACDAPSPASATPPPPHGDPRPTKACETVCLTALSLPLLTEWAARCIHRESVNAEAPVPIRTDLLTSQRFPGLIAQETAPLQHHHSTGSRGRLNRPVEEPRHAHSMPEALHPGPTVRAQASVNTNHRGRCAGAYLDSATRAPVDVSSRAMLGRAKRRGTLERGRRQPGEACPSSM